MSNATAVAAFTNVVATPGTRRGTVVRYGGFFEHHGVWAPGVRTFRALQFRTKAAIISLSFIVPILVLAWGMLRSTQETIDVAVKERTGVAAMRAVVPVLEGLLRVRNATRATLGGYDATGDLREARVATDKAIDALKKTIAGEGDTLGLNGAVNELDAAWRLAAQSASGVDDKGRTVYGPVSEALEKLRTVLADESQLVLDPAIDSYYLVNAMIVAMPQVAENIGQIWGWGTFALAKGGLDPANDRRFQTWSSYPSLTVAGHMKGVGRGPGRMDSMSYAPGAADFPANP